MPPDDQRNMSNTKEASDDEHRSHVQPTSTTIPGTAGGGGARAGGTGLRGRANTMGRSQARNVAATPQHAPCARRGARWPGRLKQPETSIVEPAVQSVLEYIRAHTMVQSSPRAA